MSGKKVTKGLGRAADLVRPDEHSSRRRVSITEDLPDPAKDFESAAYREGFVLMNTIPLKIPQQPLPKPSERSLHKAMLLDGDPDVALLERRNLQTERKAQQFGWPLMPADLGLNLRNGSQGRDRAIARLFSERTQDVARKALAAMRKAQKRDKKSSATRGSKPRIFQSKHIADRRRAVVSRPSSLKFRESARQAMKLLPMRTPSMGHRDGVRMQIRIPSLDRVAFSAQQMSGLYIQPVVQMAKAVLSAVAHKGAVRETVMRHGFLHAAKIKSSMRRSMLQAQRYMAALGSFAARSRKRAEAIKTLSSMRGSRQSRSTTKAVGRHQNIFAMPQHAHLLVQFRVQSAVNRSRVSGETGTASQRVAGKAKQSTAMVMGVAVQQMHNMMQTKAAAPFLAVRAPAAIGSRSPGIINPGLACPVPVMQEQNGRILSPDAWIDGSLYELINHIDPEIVDAFFECLLKQLQNGPASLAKNTLRQKANKCMKKGTPTISAITWASMLQEVLLQAMHHVKIFDDSGIRGSTAVRADAAMLLDLEDELFAAWEDSFCMNSIAWNLSVDNKAPVEERFPKHEDVMLSVEQQIIRRSSEAFAKDDYQSALLHTFETKVQWKAAQCCALENGDKKVSASVDLIMELVRKDRPAAARMMTIIIRHSSLNKRKMARDIFVPRWSLDDLRVLIIKLTKEHMGVVSDNYFRSQLTAWENSSLNELILDANHENAKARMKKLSPKQPIQDFVELLEKSGQDDEVLHDIWEDIARNFSKMN